MDEEKFLQSAQRQQRSPVSSTYRLDGIADAYVREKSAELGRAASVVDMWGELLPLGFYEHCNIAGISKGVLSIEAEPGPYMHELRVLTEELLEHIKDRCPRCGIRKIKITARKT